MPKLVDGDERRAVLMEATSRAIAERGLARVTLREIARAGGWSTGIVTHYFADKRALVMATFRDRADRARRHIEREVAAGVPLLDASIAVGLPIDDDRMVDWRVYLAYMGAAIGEPELGALLHERQQRFAATVTEAISAEVSAGRLRPGLDPAHEAARLVVILHGVATQAVLAPDLWPPTAQRRVVDEHLATVSNVSAR
jgi:AcrR family transcriptional regulator